MAGANDPLGQRKNALDAFLETKVAEGFRIETHTDTHAIIIVGGHRNPLWSRFRKHAMVPTGDLRLEQSLHFENA